MAGLEPLVIATFLATVNERLVEYFIAPLFDRFTWPTFWLMYVALLTGGVIAWLSGVNLFAAFMPSEVAGLVLTCIVIGGGSSLLHELFSVTKKRIVG